MNSFDKEALVYVRNTKGGATKDNFIEDHEPIGHKLWERMWERSYVCIREGKIFLTEYGHVALAREEQS